MIVCDSTCSFYIVLSVVGGVIGGVVVYSCLPALPGLASSPPPRDGGHSSGSCRLRPANEGAGRGRHPGPL